MSREIKFRQPLWDKHNKFEGWHFWGFIDGGFEEPAWSPQSSLKEAKEQSQQFAGLHDKNGKDLDWWEGDLLQGPDGLICFIEYNHIAAGFYLKNPKYPTSYWYPIYKVRNTWKKIGDIHTTPALMENGK